LHSTDGHLLEVWRNRSPDNTATKGSKLGLALRNKGVGMDVVFGSESLIQSLIQSLRNATWVNRVTTGNSKNKSALWNHVNATHRPESLIYSSPPKFSLRFARYSQKKSLITKQSLCWYGGKTLKA